MVVLFELSNIHIVQKFCTFILLNPSGLSSVRFLRCYALAGLTETEISFMFTSVVVGAFSQSHFFVCTLVQARIYFGVRYGSFFPLVTGLLIE